MDFEGRVAVVSGGGAKGDGIGNGRASAMLLAREGASVVVVDRIPELAERTAEMIQTEGGQAAAIGADATSEDDCWAAINFAVETYGDVNVLVNNVGVGSQGSILDTEPAMWQKVMDINVNSAYLMSRAAIPHMADSAGAAIVNMSSISTFRPRGLTAYSTTKGAVIALTKAMAVDHAGDGIRVNCVAPGPVFTPMVEQPGMTDEQRDARRRASVLKIEGTGWDVGNAVMFLASDRARYITGQTLVVDGGVTLRGPGR